MKLNNKGFAITATLYTILILFLMVLASVLSGLVNKEKLLEKSIESISDNYKIEKNVSDDAEEGGGDDDDGDPGDVNENQEEQNPTGGNEEGEKTCLFIAPANGKYTFTLKIENAEKSCISYLKKDTCITSANDIKYIDSECNNYKANIEKEKIMQPTKQEYFNN